MLHPRSTRSTHASRGGPWSTLVVLVVAGSVIGSAPRVLGAQAASGADEPQSAYRYRADGRRDPFRSLLARGVDRPGIDSRPSGLPGVMIDETTIKGIVLSGSTLVAMISGPDGRTFTAHVDDDLYDGSVKQITTASVVFLQDVDDPLSTVKEREVTRYLRVPEGSR
jgi:Tfp pilus assembly protein PilP